MSTQFADSPEWQPVIPKVTDPELVAQYGVQMPPPPQMQPPPYETKTTTKSIFNEYKFIIIAVVIVLIILIVVGYLYYKDKDKPAAPSEPEKKTPQPTPPPPPQNDPPPVSHPNNEELARIVAARREAKSTGNVTPAMLKPATMPQTYMYTPVSKTVSFDLGMTNKNLSHELDNTTSVDIFADFEVPSNRAPSKAPLVAQSAPHAPQTTGGNSPAEVQLEMHLDAFQDAQLDSTQGVNQDSTQRANQSAQQDTNQDAHQVDPDPLASLIQQLDDEMSDEE